MARARLRRIRLHDPQVLEPILRCLGLAGDKLDQPHGWAPPQVPTAEVVVEPFHDDLAPLFDPPD